MGNNSTISSISGDTNDTNDTNTHNSNSTANTNSTATGGVTMKGIYHYISILHDCGATMQVNFSEYYTYNPCHISSTCSSGMGSGSSMGMGGIGGNSSICKYSDINLYPTTTPTNNTTTTSTNTTPTTLNPNPDPTPDAIVIYHNTVKKTHFQYIPHEHCSVLYTINVNIILNSLNSVSGMGSSGIDSVSGIDSGSGSSGGNMDTRLLNSASDPNTNNTNNNTTSTTDNSTIKIEFEFQLSETDNTTDNPTNTDTDTTQIHIPRVYPSYSYTLSVRPSVIGRQIDPSVDVNADDIELIKIDLSGANCSTSNSSSRGGSSGKSSNRGESNGTTTDIQSQSQSQSQWMRCCCSIPTGQLLDALRLITVLGDTPSGVGGVLVITLSCANSTTMLHQHQYQHKHQHQHSNAHSTHSNHSAHTHTQPHAHAVSSIVSEIAIKQICTSVATKNMMMTRMSGANSTSGNSGNNYGNSSGDNISSGNNTHNNYNDYNNSNNSNNNKNSQHSTTAMMNHITNTHSRDQFYNGFQGHIHNKIGLNLPSNFVINNCLTIPAGTGLGSPGAGKPGISGISEISGISVEFDIRVREKNELLNTNLYEYIKKHQTNDNDKLSNLSYEYHIYIYRPNICTDTITLIESHNEHIINNNTTNDNTNNPNTTSTNNTNNPNNAYQLRIEYFFTYQHYSISLPTWVCDNDIVILAISTNGCTARQQIDYSKSIPDSDFYIEIPSLDYKLHSRSSSSGGTNNNSSGNNSGHNSNCSGSNLGLGLGVLGSIENQLHPTIDHIPPNIIHNMNQSYCM